MKKIIIIALAVSMVLSISACGTAPTSSVSATAPVSESKTVTGKSNGFGGELTVSVKLEGDKITAVTVDAHQETQDIAGPALEKIPADIVTAGKTEVEAVAGATITSKAIIAAVNNAIDPAQFPYETEKPKTEETPISTTAAKAYIGTGIGNMERLGPGKDDTDTQVYSFNQVFANAIFDDAGKIMYLKVDQLEVATPNYDGADMPHLSGFPGQGGYNYDENHDGKIDSKTKDTDEAFLAEVASWKTKRERGDTYKMGTGTWEEQMNAFEKQFVGMTVAEVETWFTKYCSDLNGRPLKIGEKSKDEDKAKYEKLSDDEKKMLADITASATMSLKDSHGDILNAIKKAYENKKPLEITEATAHGVGFASMGRIGPGKDDKETQVYSFNEVVAYTLFDKDGKIVSLNVDQIEVATPNYDGADMPHLSGFPGQGGYNYDENHDGKIDSKTKDTDEAFLAEVASWKTKRERGDAYKMGTGTWSAQMNAFEKQFVGMTVAEVETWFTKYCSDLNGRPLKIGEKSKDEDKAKYEKLSDDEKKMLADITASATMSLNDGHGNILQAIQKSFENKTAIDLKIS